MWNDIRLGLNRINKEPLVVFPLAILIVGALPAILELGGIPPLWSGLISSILAALITVIEMLRVRGRMERTAINQGRRWA